MKRGRSLRHHQKPAVRFERKCMDGFLDLCGAADRHCNRLDGERLRVRFKRTQETWRKRRCRMENQRHPLDLRCNLVQQGEPFASDRGLVSGHSGDVAAWSRKTCNNAAPDRVGDAYEHCRYLDRGLPQRLCSTRIRGHDDIRRFINEFRTVGPDEVWINSTPVKLATQVTAFCPTKGVERPAECGHPRLYFRVTFP